MEKKKLSREENKTEIINHTKSGDPDYPFNSSRGNRLRITHHEKLIFNDLQSS